MSIPPPFVVFSLPRSRTAWMAEWFRMVARAPVGHDIAIESDSVDAWLETIYRRVRGTCETGSVEAWPILRKAMPDCRIALVRRDFHDVLDSLEGVGVIAPQSDQILRRVDAMEALARQPGVLALDYDDLKDPRQCARLQEHCLGIPFDWPTWLEMEQRNVQLDIQVRLRRLTERAEQIAALKVDLAERLAHSKPWVTVGEEPWSAVADECEALGHDHHDEAKAGVEGAFKLDREILAQMERAGLWRVFVARVDMRLVGYCCWSHETNVEAAAPRTVKHGPFYVIPDYRGYQLGKRLLDVSKQTLGAAGYQVLRLHHTVHGRGAKAGKLYERMGAVEYQREYILRLEN